VKMREHLIISGGEYRGIMKESVDGAGS